MIDTFGSSHSLKDSYTFAEITSVSSIKPYVLRFWETEFSEISPLIKDNGEKIYSKDHLEFILLIKNLLFEKKMSIPEAKAFVARGDIDQTIDKLDSASEIIESENVVAKTSDSNLTLARRKLESLLSEIDSLSQTHGWDI